jgi:hypothetical protein
MVVNDDIKVNTVKTLVVVRLRINNGKTGELFPIDLFEGHEIQLKESNHGQVVRPANGVYMGDRGIGDLSPQKAFQRHGAGHGIGIGIDKDKEPIFP